MTPALILFAHGARDPAWAAPFERVLASLRARAPEREALLAYLDFLQPDLPAAVRTLVARGHRTIRVVPLFLGPGGHVKESLPALVAAARREHESIAIEIAPSVGEDDRVVEALAAYALR